jgi:hypothetical protein
MFIVSAIEVGFCAWIMDKCNISKKIWAVLLFSIIAGVVIEYCLNVNYFPSWKYMSPEPLAEWDEFTVSDFYKLHLIPITILGGIYGLYLTTILGFLYAIGTIICKKIHLRKYSHLISLSAILHVLLVAVLLLELPIVGVTSVGRPLDYYFEFPPLTTYVKHADFSWTVFCLLSLFIIAVISPFLIKIFSSMKRADFRGSFFIRPFPAWGWFAVISCAIFWVLAWNRFEWFSFFQTYTFSPLWISFIVAVNAATFARSGKCMLKNSTLYFILLFPLSSVFWWFFEYLNRFVQNWHYVGAEIFSPFEYAIFATLCFSTVLPAVLSVCEFLETFKTISMPLNDFFRVKFLNTRSAAWIVLVLACSGLIAIGRYPDYFFPILWLSPLLVITSLQTLKRQENIFSGIVEGRWGNLFCLAISALVCGFFWEMWNFNSMPKWEYSVPFVDRFHLFEMPILGYAGYLPFGIECAVLAGLLKEFILHKK